MLKVKRALVSVSDKKGLVPFVKALHNLGVEILSTGGTAKAIREAGVPVTDVSTYTGFPEMLDGRVKTLHPKIHGGLLALRDNPSHMAQIKEQGIGLIDMVVINLYPFENVIKKKNVSLSEAIANIDVGGPSMLRSAAKNYKSVAVICNPQKYDELLKELERNHGILSDAVLYSLALEAFSHTARYDQIIAEFFAKRLEAQETFKTLPAHLTLRLVKAMDLRYGENPHQEGAFYRDEGDAFGLAALKQLNGKELSFNNILDLNAAVEFIKDFKNPTAVIVKHNNPTGIAEDKDLTKAYQAALACDPVSAFGGIIGLNKNVDGKTARAIDKSGFMECIVAPSFNKEALSILKKKKNVRLIEVDFTGLVKEKEKVDVKRVTGGMLVQQKDTRVLESSDMKVVTKKKPTKAQMDAALFGWKIIRNIKSNAIVIVKGTCALGIGCGQTSRVEATRAALKQAGRGAKNAVLVSDAFLPKTDNVELAATAGIGVIIQPGGSISDSDVIKAANRYGMAMIMTGIRHFKH